MDTEDDAKDTLVDLRLKKRLFRGVSVKARLKTETVVRSFYPVQSPPIAPVGFSVPGMGFGGMLGHPGGGVLPGVPFPFMGMTMPGIHPMMVPMIPNAVAYMDPNAVAAATPVAAKTVHSNDPAATTTTTTTGNTNTSVSVSTPALNTTSPIDSQKGQSNTGTKDNSSTKKTSVSSNNNSGPSSKQVNSNNDKQNDSSNRNSKGKNNDNDVSTSNRNNKGGNNNSNNKSSSNNSNNTSHSKKDFDKPLIEVNVANFPPLGGNEEIPTPGYKGAFTKYSADEIINIAKTVKEVKLPGELDLSAHPSALSMEPNKDLLKRQRSFSIDETREQLRQGKPVQRDAVISGKVDSKSLLYGDEMNATTSTSTQQQQIQSSTVNKPLTTANVDNSNKIEIEAMVASVVDQVTNSAAELAISSSSPKLSVDTVVTNNASPSPVKITPSSWAAMVKSSEASTQTTSNKSPTTQSSKAATSGSDSKKSTLKDTGDKNGSNKKPSSGNNSNSSSQGNSNSTDNKSSATTTAAATTVATDGKNKKNIDLQSTAAVDPKNKDHQQQSKSSNSSSSGSSSNVNNNNNNTKKNKNSSNNAANSSQNEQVSILV